MYIAKGHNSTQELSFLSLTHPDFCQSHVVPDEDLVHSSREGVGLTTTENVTYP